MSEQFLTWEMLGTYAGTLGMVLILTQLTKELSFIQRIPTQLYSYLVALVVMTVTAISKPLKRRFIGLPPFRPWTAGACSKACPA